MEEGKGAKVGSGTSDGPGGEKDGETGKRRSEGSGKGMEEAFTGSGRFHIGQLKGDAIKY